MNDLSHGETVLLIVLIWATWIIFYWAGKNNLLGYMSDTISDFGKQLSESMRKTEEVKITKSERERLIEVAWRAASEYSDYLEKTLNGENTTDITDISALFPQITTFPEFLTDRLIANNVTIPPVSVGQTIYLIRIPTTNCLPAWIDKCEITYISVHYFKDGKSTVFSGYNFEVAECDIGKTVFLTREEAEQALKERSEST